MLVPAVDLDDIRARVPLTAVLLLYGEARRLEEREAGLTGECPFCHRPGFEASVATNRFHCSSCGKSGGSVEFVMQREGVSPWIAGLMLADWFRVRVRVTVAASAEVVAERLSLPLSAFASSVGYALGQLAISLHVPAEVDAAVEEIRQTAKAVMLGEGFSPSTG